ncbi:MAG: HAMP domain-containing protein [candidate division NC10 bacterium]|nr:HAMP domain-containing protein [candidate division NC10 bacterium]MBI2163641.1 HAMP domain-containing protein [candidate division NC10 bacterium]
MTLRTKILGAMALVLAITVGGSFLVLIRYQRAQLLRNTADATAHLASTIRATLEHAMLANDPAEIQRIVRTVGQQPGIQGVFVLDHTGAVKVTSRPDQAGRPLAEGPPSVPSDLPDGQTAARGETRVLQRQPSPVLRSTSLIPNTPRCQGCHDPRQRFLGALVVDRSLDPMEGQLRTSLGYMLGSAGLAFLLLTATTYAVLRRLVITPLSDLGRAARAIEAGNYDTPMTLDRTDEVGELARGLDQMRRRILEHLGEVRRWGQELEARVAERTQELRTLNRVALVTNEALDLETIFSRALEAALDALGVDAGAIILVAPDRRDPMVVQRGLSQTDVETLIREARAAGVEFACAGAVTQAGVRRFACFPVRSKAGLLGILCVDNYRVPLAEEKLRLLEALAAQLGGTAERAILHQDLERSFRTLRESQAQIVERERQIAALEALRAATVTLSHHINNAAAGIEGCRNVLAMALNDQADWQVRHALDGIRTSVRKITAVLQALRGLTRFELIPFPGGADAIDIERAIQETLAHLGPDEREAGRDPSRRPT